MSNATYYEITKPNNEILVLLLNKKHLEYLIKKGTILSYRKVA